MSRRQWSKVALGGERHLIPKVCPNCLAPSEVERRVCLQGPVVAMDHRQCAVHPDVLLLPGLRWRRRGRIPGITSGSLACGSLSPCCRWPPWLPWGNCWGGCRAGCPTTALCRRGARRPCSPPCSVVWWGLCRWLKRRALVSAPILEKQAVWGPAVYYTGDRGFGLLDLFAGASRSVYRAARPEWIRALVEANPEKVDDATYRDAVGAEKPVFAVDRRSAT